MTGILISEDDFDLKTDASGRLQVGVTDAQNQYLLLKLQKGAIKRLPERCVGADSFVEAEDANSLLREVRKQYSLDGMRVGKIAFEGDNLNIEAAYE